MFDATIQWASDKWSVNPDEIRAIIQVESNWNPNAYNPNDPTGAWGLGQILYRTALGLGYSGPPEGLFDPTTNIDLIAHLLRTLHDSWGDDLHRVFSAYNSGNPDLWQTSDQVRQYVENALNAFYDFVNAHPVFSSGLLLIGVLLAAYFVQKGFKS